jgi:carbamoyl-phosphate synthase large subunit
VHLLLNSSELIDLCADKWTFYETLKAAKSRYLIASRNTGGFAELREAFGLPFLLKPRRGFASKGIAIIESEAQFFEKAPDLGSQLMAQPIVGDKESEYTVSAFFDRESVLCCWMSLRRKLSKEGFTDRADVAEPPRMVDALRELAGFLKPVGPTNFQFRVDQGELRLLEVNPRISSATSIRAAFGYNESVMAVDYFLKGERPVQPNLRRGSAVRYTEDYIFYETDV